MAALFERHDLGSCRGRVLVAGDVHGRFADLQRELDASRYDDTVDRLVLLGDLVNRGPDSHRAGDWAHLLRVLGNHEDALLDDGLRDMARPRGRHAWMEAVGDVDARVALARALGAAPLMLEIVTPGGWTVGMAHAGVPFMNWREASRIVRDAADPQHVATRKFLLTDRDHARGIVAGTRGRVANIDHVFLGHTPVPAPVSHNGGTLCDTSRSARPVTVLDVDRWIEDNGRRTT
jgi:serine/threonine protein phosphatase 1